MAHRDADPLPPTLADPPGHARLVGPPAALRDPAAQVGAILLAFTVFLPGVPLLIGSIVWTSTRTPLGQVSALGWLARISWLLPWIGLVAMPFAPWLALPLTLASLAGLCVFVGAFFGHLRRLTRRQTEARRRLDTAIAWLGLLIVGSVLLVGVGVLLATGPWSGVALGASAVGLCTSIAGLTAWWVAAAHWQARDSELDRALAKTRLLGVPATWSPFGYQWAGAGPMREWRVIADSARVPAALRFEVTVRGTRPARIRKREPGEPGGAHLSDPILGSTLIVEGVDADRADAMLDEVHEVLLPLIHGHSAVIERGVLRVDLYPEVPLGTPWQWMERTLRQMMAVSDVVEANVIGDPPRTDEVVRQLQQISDQMNED